MIEYVQNKSKYGLNAHGWMVILLAGVVAATIVAATGWMGLHTPHVASASASAFGGNCRLSELNLSIGPSDGAAGTIYVDAVLTNQGSRVCTLRGYPDVRLTDAHNVSIGVAAIHNTTFPVTTVALHPGESAHATMGFPQPGNFDPGVCSAVSTNLRMRLPSLGGTLETPLIHQSCPGFSITAVQPGL